MRNLVLSTIFIAASAGPSGAVEFKFAPADGLECVQNLKTSRSSKIQGVDEAKREEVSQSVTNLKYEKVADGYRVTSTIQSAENKRDGKVVEDPFTKVLVGRRLVSDIASNGELKDVHGYDELVRDLLAQVPAEARPTMEKVMTTENLREREKAEWNGRIAEFVGKEAKEGDIWDAESEVPLPTGAVKFTTATRVSKVEEKDGRPMVTINFAYGADGTAAKAMMDRVLKDLAGLAQGLEIATEEPSITGGGVRVVDASTMTIERETVSRVISMPVDIPQVGKKVMIRTETKEYGTKCGPVRVAGRTALD